MGVCTAQLDRINKLKIDVYMSARADRRLPPVMYTDNGIPISQVVEEIKRCESALKPYTTENSADLTL